MKLCAQRHLYMYIRVDICRDAFIVLNSKLDRSRLRLFKEAKSGLQIIKYFSQRHTLHQLQVGLYKATCFKILPLTLKFVKFSFKYQMYLPSLVLCLLFAFSND